MNKFFANSLGVVNIIFFLLIAVGSVIGGGLMIIFGAQYGMGGMGLPGLLIILVYVLVALLTCGIIALMLAMHQELVRIRVAMEQKN